MRVREIKLLVCTILVVIAAVVNSSEGAPYPEKSITLVVPYAPGGVSDTGARAAAEAAKSYFPKAVVVENRPGASGTVGVDYVANAKPDGYTLLWGSNTELASTLHVAKTPYTMESYDVVLYVGAVSNLVVVRTDSPFKTWKELFDYAKANPGKLKAGNPGEGSGLFLTCQLAERATGAKFTSVPFQGSGPVIPAVLGGHLDVGFLNVVETMPHKASGQMRVLLAFADQRPKVMPDIATAREVGINVVGGSSHAVVAPKGLNSEVRNSIEAGFRKALADRKFLDVLEKIGYDVQVKSGQEGFQIFKDWYKASGEIYEQLGIKPK